MLHHLSIRTKITVMIAVMFCLLLAALDQTIVATAMPRIVQQLNGLQHLSWVFTAYLLASTVTVPIYGKLSDMYGRRPFIMGAIVTFLVGSALSGQSHNMTELILFRGLQGIGGGALMANAFAVIGDLFVPAERGRWQGLFAAVFGLASVIGPLLGGWITDNASWRWIFYINLPVGLVALTLISIYMPKIKGRAEGRKIDFLGAGLLATTLVTMILATTWGGTQYAWNSATIIGTYAASAVALGLFILAETRAQEPILPLHLFRNRVFVVSMVAVLLSGLAMFGGILYIPLFAQYIIGSSATNSGIILTPMMAGLIVTSVIAGQFMSRTGKYKALAVIGMGIVVVAMYWLAHVSATTTQAGLIWRMVVMGAGLGMTMPVFNLAVQNAFSQRELGVVSASTQLFRSIGGTVGTAVMAGVLNNSLTKHLGDIGKTQFAQLAAHAGKNIGSLNATSVQGLLSKQGQALLHSGAAQVPAPARPIYVQALANFVATIKIGLASSIADVFWVSTGLMALAFVVTLFLKEIPLRRSNEEETPGLESDAELVADELGAEAVQAEPALTATTRSKPAGASSNVLDLRQR
jgi:EmrB/QacA subfamily drug resistance transporter